MRRLLLALAIAVGAAACGSNQDPDIIPTSSSSGVTASTGVLLGPCPPDGPDATTPPEGCLLDDGSVARP